MTGSKVSDTVNKTKGVQMNKNMSFKKFAASRSHLKMFTLLKQRAEEHIITNEHSFNFFKPRGSLAK